jgi:hypothetical protein
MLRLAIGEQASEALPDLAANALVRGLDTESLRELAGTPAREVRDSRDLFLRSVSELGWTIPDELTARRELAIYTASEMADGRLEPYEASSWIWHSAWWQLGTPNDLGVFVGLASEWEDHPAKRPELERLMVQQARSLVSGSNG